DEAAGVHDLGRVVLAVALHEERLLRGLAHQRALAPEELEKGLDAVADAYAQRVIVRLKDETAGMQENRLLDHVGQAPDRDVAVFARAVGGRARAPDQDAGAEFPDTVDAVRVENLLLLARHPVLEAQRAAHDLVGRRLVDAALAVGARVDARDVARGR